ncbi:MAG: Mpo1-like protein [Casimicrobium sp.]
MKSRTKASTVKSAESQASKKTKIHSAGAFAEFYPLYLDEHRNAVCRALHFIGTTTGLICLIAAFISHYWWLIPVGIVQGYLWAWIGHFWFEKNKPASFQKPLYSFMGDWLMWFQLLTRKLTFRGRTDDR